METPKVKNETAKRDDLVAFERQIQIAKLSHDSHPHPKKPKFFVTFPFAYMNGLLHLGHAYTISKADFNVRFMKLCGYNVLFPFGFHGTGTPIVACAKKLRESLLVYDLGDMDKIPETDQIKILYNMNVPQEEIPKFVDPNYWLQYFPEKAIMDLRSFGAYVDYRRSFITTELNPYFDSFVRWQFQNLNQKGYLRFGKKPIIFSPKDNQACSDHDRSVGEGVGFIEFNVYYGQTDDGKIFCLTDKNTKIDPLSIKQIIVSPDEKLTIFRFKDHEFIAREEFVRNFKYQIDDQQIEIIGCCKGSDLIDKNIHVGGSSHKVYASKKSMDGSGFKILFHKPDENNKENLIEKSQFKYYEPESDVISRSGDKCVVAVIDQWFIDYGHPELKRIVNDHINSDRFNMYEKDVLTMLKKASDWIQEWPCSRSFGLGTKLLDTEYVIDSLSDSTIYMAFYTQSHLINKIPFEYFKEHEIEIWNYILLDKTFPNVDNEYCSVIKEMKSEFDYWYSVDLRVSGKDLVSNHLIMALYNHAMIWGDRHLPKNYHINGYILLNGKKMSKSQGNFMTLKEAVNKYGADATRNALAEAGSGMDDANFNEKNADMAVRRLYTEREWIKKMIEQIKDYDKRDEKGSIWDFILVEEIKQCMNETFINYKNLDYQKVMSQGIYKMLSIRDNYKLKYEKGIIQMSHQNMKMFIETFLIMISPICPHFSEYLWEYAENTGIKFMKEWPKDLHINQKMICYRDVFNSIITQINQGTQNIIKKYKKKDKDTKIEMEVTITIIEKFSDLELAVIHELEDRFKQDYKGPASWKSITEKILEKKDKKDFQNYGKIIGYVRNQVEIYGSCYFEICYDATELCKIIGEWIPQIFNDVIKINQKDKGDQSTIFKYGPTCPIVSVIKKN